MRISYRRMLCAVALSFVSGLSVSGVVSGATGPIAIGPAFEIENLQPASISIGAVKVAKADDGSFVVASTRNPGDVVSDPYHLVVQRYTANGTPLTPQILVNSSLSYLTAASLQLATDAQGNFLVGWAGASFQVQAFDAQAPRVGRRRVLSPTAGVAVHSQSIWMPPETMSRQRISRSITGTPVRPA